MRLKHTLRTGNDTDHTKEMKSENKVVTIDRELYERKYKGNNRDLGTIVSS
jgi:hypothetical protein